MDCESGIKRGAIDGVIIGSFAGFVLGLLDSVMQLMFSRNSERINVSGRIFGSIAQGGMIGFVLGAVFAIPKYCFEGPCMLNMKSGMVDGMLVGMLLGAAYGAVQVFRAEETPDTQKAAIDIADWSVHVAVVCALIGALLALAKGI